MNALKTLDDVLSVHFSDIGQFLINSQLLMENCGMQLNVWNDVSNLWHSVLEAQAFC